MGRHNSIIPYVKNANANETENYEGRESLNSTEVAPCLTKLYTPDHLPSATHDEKLPE